MVVDPNITPRLRPTGNWSYPHNRWNSDEEIIGDWMTLKVMIELFVEDVFPRSIPDIDTSHDVYPYEALTRHSDLAGPIVRSENHAKYIFQLSIWNILNLKYLGHMATEWACEERGVKWSRTRTKGLAEAIFRNTCEYTMTRPPPGRQQNVMWQIFPGR